MGLGAKCGNTKKRFSIARSASACSTATARSHSGSKPHRRVAHLFQAPTHRPTHDLGRTVTSPRLPTPCSLASSQRLVLSAFWQYSLRHRVPVSTSDMCNSSFFNRCHSSFFNTQRNAVDTSRSASALDSLNQIFISAHTRFEPARPCDASAALHWVGHPSVAPGLRRRETGRSCLRCAALGNREG
jgi:septal ring-binding cell division protein DamX